MKLNDVLKNRILCLDGGMGTLLQQEGLQPGEYPERWNLSHGEVIRRIHLEYLKAGSHMISTNTFGANLLKFSETELEELIAAAVANARWACGQITREEPCFVALDVGPLGRLLSPLGDLDFEDAVAIFAKTVQLGVRYGVDAIFIETMNDSYETKAAVLAAKENSTLPVLVSNAYGADGKLMTGASPAAMVAMLEGLGVDAIGANCSLGPAALRPVVSELLAFSRLPVILKPNAGLPRSEGGQTVYDITPADFAEEMAECVREGVRAVGGCCGTTPRYIAEMTRRLFDVTPAPLAEKEITMISSFTHAVVFDRDPVLIGERINPTGKKRFKQALRERDIGYILEEGVHQQERGAAVLDVNVGLPDIDEAALLTAAVTELQAVLDLPLQIDTADPLAMEQALRRYNGKAMVNSVSGKEESLRAILPLVKKYGGLVVALTLDDEGIPATAAGRLAVARRILARAAEYGIAKKDIIFDPLAMAVSADGEAAAVTLETLSLIREELGCHTSLGVSNVSFGLPCRDAVNSTFFAAALEKGLSAAIMNPYSTDMMRTYHAHRVLHGLDPSCAAYLAFCEAHPAATEAAPTVAVSHTNDGLTALQRAIAGGRREQAAALTAALLKESAPLDVVNGEIIPALDAVGRGFEQKTVYLPQLLMSAEAAKSAFEVIKGAMQGGAEENKGTVVLATVSGDIHDIGKNIVRLLLDNYGFSVVDLGRDVSPEAVLSAVLAHRAPLCGLSALMTTTVPAMEQTIALLHEKAPFCRVMVGGAVLNAEYAARIGADHYAPDAMDGVRYAEHCAATPAE